MSSGGCVGISISYEGVACAHVGSSTGTLELLHCEYRSCNSKAKIEAELDNIVEDLKLIDLPCVIAVAPEKYSLFLVESIEFSPENKKEILGDRVKDMMDYPIEEAVFDYIALPESPNDGKKMAYIVVAKQSDVDEQVEMVEQSGLNVRAVDIASCALRNVAINLDRNEEGFFYLHLFPGSSQLMLIRNSRIEMIRHLEMTVKYLFPEGAAESSNSSTGERDALIDAIVMEIEKSLKYMEGVLGQPSVNKILLAPMNKNILECIAGIEARTGTKVRATELSESLSVTDKMVMEHQQRCIIAVGAALRDDLDELDDASEGE